MYTLRFTLEGGVSTLRFYPKVNPEVRRVSTLRFTLRLTLRLGGLHPKVYPKVNPEVNSPQP